MADNTLPKAPKHSGVDPLTTGKTFYPRKGVVKTADEENASTKKKKKSSKK